MPRILTIDDSSTIRSIITKQMSDLGFEVDHAENGQHGLSRLESGAVDLILLDVTMPVMDGPTMLAALRERGDRTPVIMLTSESKRTIVAGAIKLGIEDYILKPFKPDELRAKVLKALRLEAAAVDDLLSKHMDIADDVLAVVGNVLECAAFTGKEDKVDRYFARLRTLCHESLVKLASACYEDTIFDLSAIPMRNDEIVRLLMESDKEARKLGISLRLVGTPEVKRLLGTAMETAALPFYATRAEAQNGS